MEPSRKHKGKRLMKKIFLLVSIVLILCGCTSSTDAFMKYQECIDYFVNTNNYTIEEITDDKKTIYIYTDNICYMNDGEDEIYISKEDNNLYLIGYSDEYNAFVKEQVDYDDHYLYPYNLLERFEKISGFINNGSITFRNDTFYGDDLKGKYLYDEEVHEPIEIKIDIDNEHISKFYEKYKCNDEVLESNILIYDYGTSRITLPLNVFDVEEK